MNHPAPVAVNVRHNPSERRFEAEIGGHLAVAEYALDGDRMTFTHTLVPPELRGKGLAEKLVRAGLAEARAQGRRVVPACSYVAAFIERHAEFKDLLA
jgi:predicted GNAT family acetyltransferase